jgi:palmitoyltransferase ZDHHC2/15/20
VLACAPRIEMVATHWRQPFHSFCNVLMEIVLSILQLAMLLWSYFSVVFTDPGSVPPNWNLDFDVETGETAPLASSEFNGQMNSQQSMTHGGTGNPRVRYCRKCNQLKPPRCHHCSVCKLMA